jgi:hypothetical protein
MLRIDVGVADGHPTGYQVPPDNPFARGGLSGVRPEIWSFGLRNPWRYSFDDPGAGGAAALIIGDVGQNASKRSTTSRPNTGGRGNYGWRNREGAHDNVTSRAPAFLPLIDPIHEYDRGVGQSVTGGYVYRGSALPASFRGRYFFADFVQGRVFSLALAIDARDEAQASDLVEHTASLSNAGALGNVTSFGVDTGRRAVPGRLQHRPDSENHRPRRRAARCRPGFGSFARSFSFDTCTRPQRTQRTQESKDDSLCPLRPLC